MMSTKTVVTSILDSVRIPPNLPAIVYASGGMTSGKINIDAFVQTRPMSTIVETFDEAHSVSPDKRIVLTPDF